MLKTWKQTKAQRSELVRKVPKSVQEFLPARTIWEDGTFFHGNNLYSRCYRFSDINYAISDAQAREELNQRFQQLLTGLGGGATFKITSYHHKLDMVAWEKEMLFPMAQDGQDPLRKNYNDFMRQEVDAADGRAKEMFLTLTVWRQSLEEAKSYFGRAYLALQRSFSGLGSQAAQLDAVERLRILHDFFRPGQESQFHFDFHDSIRRGHDFRDAICPESLEIHEDYIKFGNRYARGLICVEYAPRVTDELLDKLTEAVRDMIVSVDVVNIPSDEAASEAQTRLDGVEGSISRWQQRQTNAKNYAATIPYPLQQQREEMNDFLDQLTKHGQMMHKVTMTVVHTAASLEQLNADTAQIQALRECKFFPGTFQQPAVLTTALPFGVCQIDAARTLLTQCLAAIAMPFKVQEVSQPGGYYIGHNSLTRNPIFCNFSTLMNQGMLILGIPGSGKSMLAKLLLTAIALKTQDTIIINDPEGEYAPLVQALGGTVIQLRAGGEDHINAMGMEQGYGLKNAYTEKALFVQSLVEQMQDAPLTAQEKSVLDRCVLSLYEDCSGKPVTLIRLRQELLRQREPEAKSLALILERYTTGSLDVFAHETNVDLSNRILCFDQHEIRDQLRSAAQHVIADVTTNLVNVNCGAGRRTHVFTDEMHRFYTNKHSAEFFDTAWRQWRKRNGYPTGITQNISTMMVYQEAKDMVSNSQVVIMLNQSDVDRAALEEQLHLSATQMDFVHGAAPGSGLLRYGSKVLPFTNNFPRDTELYRLVSTKPEDGFKGGEHL